MSAKIFKVLGYNTITYFWFVETVASNTSLRAYLHFLDMSHAKQQKPTKRAPEGNKDQIPFTE